MRIQREIFGAIFLWLISYGVHAQDERFIYFQSDHQQPFYVKTENRIYSASESGYVIISSIPEGHAFNFTLGFPKNTWPSQHFTIDPLQKDRGFRLTQTDSSNWSLYDFQSGDLLSAFAHSQQQTGKLTFIDDEFVNVLAEVSHTPSLRENRIKKDNIDSIKIKTATLDGNVVDTVQEIIVKRDNPQINNDTAQTLVVAESTTVPLSTIRKQTEYITDSGRVIQYVVTDGELINTVDVLIPIDKIIQPKEVPNVDTAMNSAAAVIMQSNDSMAMKVISKVDSISTKNSEAVKTSSTDTTYLNGQEAEVKMDRSTSTVTTAPVVSGNMQSVQNVELKQIADTSSTNTAKISAEIICSTAATEKDIIDLRRTMVREDDEAKMLMIASEAMKEKCFYTEQLRNLAVLFLNEDNRLSYLMASYRYCIDKEKFTSLSNLLNQEKNINVFKEQIH